MESALEQDIETIRNIAHRIDGESYKVLHRSHIPLELTKLDQALDALHAAQEALAAVRKLRRANGRT